MQRLQSQIPPAQGQFSVACAERPGFDLPASTDPVRQRLDSIKFSRELFEASLRRGQLVLGHWCSASK
jgi:hypothetical protein